MRQAGKASLALRELEARQRENGPELYYALVALVKTWEDPGLMGILYAMPRAVSYAKSVLSKIESDGRNAPSA